MTLIFGSPGRYIQGPGAISYIGEAIAHCGGCATVVVDGFVRGLVEAPIAAACAERSVTARLIDFTGEVTRAGIAGLLAAIGDGDVSCIVAVGGGKSIDAGKAVTLALGVPLITLPTVASNDAPTSKNFVIYDDYHQLLEVAHLPANARYVIVDTRLIRAAPAAFLRAGIGDALTKVFEAEQCLRAAGRNMFGVQSSLAGVALARECYRVLRAEAVAGLSEVGRVGEPSPGFERLIEAVLLMSGLGFESGGLSITHAMTRGLSRAPGANATPHGLQVAYALLVQLVLENRDNAFLEDLLDFYAALGLPRCFAEIGGTPDDATFAIVAEPTLAAPHARNFERVVTVAEMVAAMRQLESRAENKPQEQKTGKCNVP
jgi:glycerol dehydrogenase